MLDLRRIQTVEFDIVRDLEVPGLSLRSCNQTFGTFRRVILLKPRNERQNISLCSDRSPCGFVSDWRYRRTGTPIWRLAEQDSDARGSRWSGPGSPAHCFRVLRPYKLTANNGVFGQRSGTTASFQCWLSDPMFR